MTQKEALKAILEQTEKDEEKDEEMDEEYAEGITQVQVIFSFATWKGFLTCLKIQ